MKILFKTLSVLFLVSCGNSIELKEKPRLMAQDELPASILTFKSINEKILKENCIGCHPGYTDYEAVFKEKDKILSAVQENRMPKNNPSLNEELKFLLKTWVEKGAPGENEEELEPSSKLKSTWEYISKKIIFPKCVQCHNPKGEASFLDLSTRQKIFDHRKHLFNNFENVRESYFIEVVQDTEEPMPPEWSNMDRLSELEIETLIEWIEKGLP